MLEYSVSSNCRIYTYTLIHKLLANNTTGFYSCENIYFTLVVTEADNLQTVHKQTMVKQDMKLSKVKFDKSQNNVTYEDLIP